MFCLTHGLSSSSVLFCPSSSGPKETSWIWSDLDIASLLCLSPSDAVVGEGKKFNNGTYSVQSETYCNVLTNDGATLCTVNMICADFHPTVEVHLREGLHIAMSAEMHTFILSK